MSQQIYIWNSMARRRRSASDIFEENGLQILKAHLLSHGYDCTIFDWATSTGYKSLSPFWLQIVNHFLVKRASGKAPQNKWGRIAERTQNKLGDIQEKRFHKKLRDLAKLIAKRDIKILGIKVWYGEAFTMAKYLIRQVNKYSPETIVVAGGYHASLYEEDILNNSNFDFAVAGSGEYALVRVMDLLENEKEYSKAKFLKTLIANHKTKPIPGFIYRDGAIVVPQKNMVNGSISGTVPLYDKKSGKIKIHILLESIGCPWNACNFCVHNKFSKGYQSRKIEDIIAEMKEMIRQGIALFRFAGSETPPKYGKKIAQAIMENQISIEYTIGCRAVKNCSDPAIYSDTVDAFKYMLLSGLRGIFMGGETGNNLVNQQVMNKGVKAKDIIYTVKAMREAESLTNIKCTVSLAMIFPTPLIEGIKLETVESDNLQLIQDVQPDAVMVSPPGPFKNTKWYYNADEFGFELKDNYINRMMEYEYVLYKPLNLWPEVPFTLKGMGFMEMLGVSQSFKQKIEKELGITTDLSDEHFLMIRTSGDLSKERIRIFKKKSQLSIISSNYRYLKKIERKVNAYSLNLARQNKLN